MECNNIRWMIGGLAMVLVLVVPSATVRGGYIPPTAGALLGEVVAFVDDFGSWNTSHDGLPLEFWVNTPADEQGERFLWLFWLWLNEPKIEAATDALIEDLLMGPFGDDLCSFLWNPGAEPPGFPGSGGSTPPAPTGDGGSTQQPGSNGASGEDPPISPGVDPVPAPATLTMLVIGGIDLLIYCWMRRRGFAGHRKGRSRRQAAIDA